MFFNPLHPIFITTVLRRQQWQSAIIGTGGKEGVNLVKFLKDHPQKIQVQEKHVHEVCLFVCFDHLLVFGTLLLFKHNSLSCSKGQRSDVAKLHF